MSLHPQTKIGHVHLTVRDLARSLAFYRDILGFEVTQKIGGAIGAASHDLGGVHAIFLSAGGYHHHIGLNTWAGKDAKKAPEGHTGLYHFAILYPTRRELASALHALTKAKYPIDGTADHGVSEAIYLHDPDGNGVELYVDRDKKDWPKNKAGEMEMKTEALDVGSLLRELEK